MLLGTGYVSREDELRDGMAYDFLDSIADHSSHALVDIEGPCLCIDQPDPLVSSADDSAVLLLGDVFVLLLFLFGIWAL
jgi:hypothetical protein